MAGVNKVIILGHLGRDPEQRNFTNGGSVVNLRLATSERYKSKDGEQQEKTEWHSVAIFNEKLGEIAMKYLKKGSLVYIEGQLSTRKYTADGVEKYTTEIVLQKFRGELTLVGRAGDGDDADRGETRGTSERKPAPAAADLDDDIPF